MAHNTNQILSLIKANPGIRQVEIADKVDCDMDAVEWALKVQIEMGDVVPVKTAEKQPVIQEQKAMNIPVFTPPPVTEAAPAADDTASITDHSSVVVTPNKYQRQVKGTVVDVYDILKAWDVRNPAVQHAIKKLLQPGQRGHKDALQDLREAGQSIERAIELEDNEL
jgi:hypothetical protein